MPLFKFQTPKGANIFAAGFYRGLGGRPIIALWFGNHPVVYPLRPLVRKPERETKASW